MNGVWGVLAVFTVAMLLIAGAVFRLNDESLLVPPPESVAEGFTRALVAGRYDRALPYLSEELAAEEGPEGMLGLAYLLRLRTGKVLNVQGEPGWMTNERADAAAVIETASGDYVRLTFPMSRRQGVWSISSLHRIEQETGR
ncbi:MAG TPA: hypothetical protein VKA70_19295 [Blastocatellia bacterium]|nr:hypothetical protein [Blastocatellia bacterium]